MKSEGKKTPLPLRYLCGILAVWTVLIGFSKFAGGHAGSGSIRIPAAALLLIVIPAAVFAISRLGTLCACMRSHSGALRRGTALLGALTLSLSAFTLPAEAATSGSLSDTNIGLSESAFSAGTPGKGTATNKTASSSWAANGTQIIGTVTPAESSETSGGGCGGSTTTHYYSSEATSTLTITNQSAEKSLLTFSYTVPSAGGTLTIDGTAQTKASSFSRTLDPNGTVLIKLTTSATPASSTSSNPSAYAASATLSNLSLTSLNRDISVTFAQPAHGSYTVKAGSTTLKVGETYTKPVSTTYTLSARADANYVFDGWYVNHDTKVSVAATYTAAFSDDCTVEARFVEDPLFTVIQMSDAGADKSAYVEVNSSYYHSEKGSYHTNVGDTSANNSYGAHTYFPYSTWSASNGAIQSSASGTATGDNQTTWGYSQASATLYSDIIRVKCKENCIITFDSSMDAHSVSISNSGSSDNQYGVFLYYYTTASASANASTIKTNGTAAIEGSKKTNGNATGTRVVVNKGEYLYLYAYAKTRKDKMTNSGYETDNYSYTAKIFNFTVTPNTIEHTLTTGNRDNTGAVLKYGSVKINGTAQSVSSGTCDYKAAENATLTLTPGTAPTGYTFIGWHNVTDNESDYTSSTYMVKMTKDYEVYPIYVPAMTITAGGTDGYGSADYQYKSLSGGMVPSNGQYVARNADCSKFYTDLNAAFSDTDIVFLLAGDTFNGSLTIPTNKTLVIPDRLADPGPGASQPEQVTSSAGISSYCKVTLNGNLTVDGKLVVNGMQSGAANNGVCGRAAGGIGYLSLSGSAAITVSSGGELCGYGQIRGGSISAEKGSTVRELMEISDKRTALVMKEIDDQKSSKRVFPFNNFSIKTIESPVTYASGAKLYAQYSVMLEGNNHSAGAVLIFGSSGALFNLTEGSMTKSFDLAADKTVYRLNEGGKMGTGSFQLDVKFGVSGFGNTTITIKSQEYWMPLNAGFDLRTAGDMTVNSDFKFLPGASLSVEKGGTCTVASGAKLLFYRLNDYDTREIGKGEYQKGYSMKVYPVNATNLPGGGYKHPTLETVGSARLNVDGEMIVKGGLYVSNDPVSESDQDFGKTELVDGVYKTRKEINAADFTVYDNGYNVLTGTGAINMTAAQTSETKVYEAMTSQNTNDPAWAPIKITPVAGLKADASADTPENYQPLNTQATYYGVYCPDGFYIWMTEAPKIAKIVNGTNEQIFRSLTDAVYNYTGEGYIQMIANSTEPGFTLDKDLCLDLNGYTVTGDFNMSGHILHGMDSTTDAYDGAKAGKIVGTVSGYDKTYQTPTVTGNEGDDAYKRYVAIPGEENGKPTVSFHRFNISVSGYRFELAAPQCALFFIGKFQGDDAAKNYLTSLGFTLTDIDNTERSYICAITGKDIPDMPAEGEEITSEVVRDVDGAYLFEAYLIHNIEKGKPATYQTPFTATAQATFGNNGKQSEERKLSFQDAWENPGEITTEQKEILDKFLAELGITKQTE
nr:hypothetical protein [uncultured Dysosmobacter sp.]